LTATDAKFSVACTEKRLVYGDSVSAVLKASRHRERRAAIRASGFAPNTEVCGLRRIKGCNIEEIRNA
jgi:hypothetical protein